MRIGSIALVLSLAASSAMAQSQPQVYALSDDGQTTTSVNPQPVKIVHHNFPAYQGGSVTYAANRQPQQPVDDQEQDQPAPLPPPRKVVRNQMASRGQPFQLVLVPDDAGPEDASAYVLGVYGDRSNCQQALSSVYDALGAGDPQFYLVCQPHQS